LLRCKPGEILIHTPFYQAAVSFSHTTIIIAWVNLSVMSEQESDEEPTGCERALQKADIDRL
jgi:hypothetical protein